MAYTVEQFAALNEAKAKAEDLVSSLRIVLDLSEPTKVQNVSASATDSTATITWAEATGAPRVTSYNVYRGGVLVAATASTILVETSVANGTYVYAVEAVDGNGRTGDQGSSNSVIVAVSPPIPDVPGTFNASVVSATRIDLSWSTPSSGATPTGYELDYSLTGTSGWTNIPLSGTGVTKQHTGLTANTRYFYRIRSVASGNYSGYATDNDRTLTSTSDTPDYDDPISGVTRTQVVIVSVSTTNELSLAIGNAVAGTTIQLTAGTYAGNVSVNRTFSAQQALVIKGAANFGSIATGTWTLSGARNIVKGIDFSGTDTGVALGGTNNKVIGCKIHGWGTTSDVQAHAINAQANSSQCEIAYNEIYSPGAYGGTNNRLRMGVRTNDDGPTDFHYDGWIHHNYFHTFPDKPISTNYSSGQSDFIELGQTQTGQYPTINSGWYVEYNLFEDHLQGTGVGAGCIDYKVGGVVHRYNTNVDVIGRVDSRGATSHGSTFESNWHDSNSGGSIIHGHGHRIIGNKYLCTATRGRIALRAGDLDCQETGAHQPGGGHARTCQVLVAGNTANLRVGEPNDTSLLAASGTTIEQHTQVSGSISFGHHTGTTNNSGSATSVNFTAATQLASSDVGPSALSSSASAYRTARGL